MQEHQSEVFLIERLTKWTCRKFGDLLIASPFLIPAYLFFMDHYEQYPAHRAWSFGGVAAYCLVVVLYRWGSFRLPELFQLGVGLLFLWTLIYESWGINLQLWLSFAALGFAIWSLLDQQNEFRKRIG